VSPPFIFTFFAVCVDILRRMLYIICIEVEEMNKKRRLKMKNSEVAKIIMEIVENGEYEFYGIRFEDKSYSVGDVVANSKHNPDREDERDFPEYGTKEYEECEDLDGASAWRCVDSYGRFIDECLTSNGGWRETMDSEAFSMCDCEHVYIVAGNRENTHDDSDENEIVIESAVVIGVLR
jgi:hypothetical protein